MVMLGKIVRVLRGLASTRGEWGGIIKALSEKGAMEPGRERVSSLGLASLVDEGTGKAIAAGLR